MCELPATATDALVRASFVVRTKGDGYTIVAAPDRPDFWFANCLVLDCEPAPASYAAWMERHAAAFAGTRVKRRVIVWETTRQTVPLPYDGPFERELSTVLAVRDLPQRKTASATLREFDRPSDWEAAVAIERRQVIDEGQPAHTAFVTWRFGIYRADAALKRCRLWGAFRDGELLAFAGTYANDTHARFITPVTQPASRQQGLFAALCNVAVGETLGAHPKTTIVIVAARGDDPERIYLRLGFAPIGEQHALIGSVNRA